MRHLVIRAVRRVGSSRQGNAGVEFALILPLLMLLCFGAIELGRALHDYHVVNETVRDAARFLSRSSIDCGAAAPGSCATCDARNGTCSGGCFFTDTDDVIEGVELAMTGDTDGGSELLAYWPHPPASANGEVDIQICAMDNSVSNLAGMYTCSTFFECDPLTDAPATMIPHVRLQANVDFQFLFGQLVVSDATIDFEIAHNVIATGE